MLLGGNLATALLFAAALGIFSAALGHPISFLDALFIHVSVALLAGVLPVPGGIGVVEAGLTFGLAGTGDPRGRRVRHRDPVPDRHLLPAAGVGRVRPPLARAEPPPLRRRTPQSSTWVPTSKTRSGGRLKNREALSAPRCSSTKRCSNAGCMPRSSPWLTISRPTKYVASSHVDQVPVEVDERQLGGDVDLVEVAHAQGHLVQARPQRDEAVAAPPRRRTEVGHVDRHEVRVLVTDLVVAQVVDERRRRLARVLEQEHRRAGHDRHVGVLVHHVAALRSARRMRSATS